MKMRDELMAIGLLAAVAVGISAPPTQADPVDYDKRMEWFLNDKLGMFIHWGVYSDPAGEWRGQPVPGAYAEWIMNDARIPVEVYEKEIAAKFNPVDFDAEEWVRLAKNAGMKYIVITAKHHDGFAMYDSEVSPYNIVDFTPFGRDPMKELAAACRRHDIKLCFYYSQTKDWHHPDGEGNHWDYPDEDSKNFTKYLEEKSIPQVRELLTEYGPIGLMWFDTPGQISKQQSRDLAKMVRSIQPHCIVSGRVGHGEGDYKEMGDNYLPKPDQVLEGPWGTSATMNHSYGYKKSDTDWKSAETLIHNFIDVVCKGGTYLLNVGPTGRGAIPPESVERLGGIGAWMDVNSEAIYNTRPYTTSYEGDHVRFTQSSDGHYLYAICLKWPGDKLTLSTVRAKPGSAIWMLGAADPLQWEQDDHALSIEMPDNMGDANSRPCKHAWVLRIEPGKTLAMPVIQRLDAGSEADRTTVAMKAEEGSTIHYTLDGSPPDVNSATYTQPFVLRKYARIRARAFQKGLGTSQTAKANMQVGASAAADVPASSLARGLNYYIYEGSWSKIPKFAELPPVESGSQSGFQIRAGDHYGMRFSGYIDVPEDGEYKFYTESDDGSMLYIDGFLVVENDGLHGAEESKGGSIVLEKGLHKIVVEYFERMGGEVLHVSYQQPGAEFPRPIPNSVLYRTKSK
jgi:alpha-L-fucosidase